jgi:GNAT superfamily N-acetyltransferase
MKSRLDQLPMKICSLKVAVHGKGLGRVLIRTALRKARESKCDGIYVTIYPCTKETDALIRRLKECGFLYHGHRGSEEVYARNV